MLNILQQLRLKLLRLLIDPSRHHSGPRVIAAATDLVINLAKFGSKFAQIVHRHSLHPQPTL